MDEQDIRYEIEHDQWVTFTNSNGILLSAKMLDWQETYDGTVIPPKYLITSHDGAMPAFHASEYDTMDELLDAMKEHAPLDEWQLAEDE